LHAHNGVMLKAGQFGMALVFAALAGCGTPPRLNPVRGTDWVSEDVASAPVARADSKPVQGRAPATPFLGSPATIPAVTSTPPLGFLAATNPPGADGQTWVSLERWCKANGLPQPMVVSAGPPPTYAIYTLNGNFTLRTGSRVMTCDRMQLSLGFAPQVIGGELYLHSLDLKKTLRPLAIGMPKLASVNQIIIDPGHGGENAGTRSAVANRHEKEFTLDWAERLGSLLSTDGWEVVLTRTSDVDLSLSNRTAIADSHKADLFISLHFNSAAPNDAEAGLETYCLTPAGMPSTVTRGFPDDASLVFLNNSFDQQNLQVAAAVHRAMLQMNGSRDRGVRRARFLGVLRNQKRPAILIEGGYLSNPREARLIAEPAYRQKLAEAVAQGLVSVLGAHREREPIADAKNR
jgi:N-acetylmuramoyl-L-alanine amidase